MVAGGTGGGAQAATAIAALSTVATAEVERVRADIRNIIRTNNYELPNADRGGT